MWGFGMRKVIKTISSILFCVLFVFAAFFVGMKFMGEDPNVFGYNFYYILTGSMEPELSAGDIIIGEAVEPSDLKTGDVVVYRGEYGQTKGKTITHEIVDIKEENGEVLFITKGTANDIEDPPVTGNQIISRMTVKVPVLGKIFSIVNSRWGFFIIIILPLVCLLANEIYSLIKVIKSGKEEQNNDETAQQEKTVRSEETTKPDMSEAQEDVARQEDTARQTEAEQDLV